VAHEPQSLPDVRRADAASWKYGRPAGVAFLLQVSANKVEPAPSNCRLNLLSKDCCRAALADESHPRRPQVASVIGCLARSSGTERLTRAGTGPNRSVIGPSGETQGDGPAADAGEEMALVVAGKVGGSNIDN
jgi:hypothetical protein